MVGKAGVRKATSRTTLKATLTGNVSDAATLSESERHGQKTPRHPPPSHLRPSPTSGMLRLAT